jgi:hypothetical protein
MKNAELAMPQTDAAHTKNQLIAAKRPTILRDYAQRNDLLWPFDRCIIAAWLARRLSRLLMSARYFGFQWRRVSFRGNVGTVQLRLDTRCYGVSAFRLCRLTATVDIHSDDDDPTDR